MNTTAQSTSDRVFIPFRSREKLKQYRTLTAEAFEDHSIPKWTRKKQIRYSIHHVHGPHTWMIDYFFFTPDGKVIENNVTNENEAKRRNLIVVLAMMHCNSRLFCAFIVDARTQAEFRDLLNNYFVASDELETFTGISRPKIDTIISDYEKSFGLDVNKNEDGTYEIVFDGSGRSIDMAQLYKRRHIKHISYNVASDDNGHSKMALIDRMARTLRDMIYNARRMHPWFTLNDETLTQMCKQYNHSIHSTLSSIIGFAVTPFDVYVHQDLQNEICRRTMEANYRTAQHILDEDIKIGKELWVYQPHVFGKKRRNNVEDDPYEVVDYLGPAAFQVRNKNDGSIKNRTRVNLVVSRNNFNAYEISK